MVALLTLGALTATVVALLRYAPIGAAVGIVTAAAGLHWLYSTERMRRPGQAPAARSSNGEIRVPGRVA